MTAKHCLCVGGPIAGEVRTILHGETMRIQARMETPAGIPDALLTGDQPMTVFHYKMSRWHTNRKELYLMIPLDWTDDQAFIELCAGYTASKVKVRP